MKLRIDIDRGHYNASMEFSDEEGENLKDIIKNTLNELDDAIKSSSGLWNSSMNTSDSLTILPTGSVRFHNPAISQIDQLVLLTGMGGTRGITVQEASELLAIPSATIASRFTGEKYKKLFRRIEEGRYALSKDGSERLDKLASKEIVGEDEIENEA